MMTIAVADSSIAARTPRTAAELTASPALARLLFVLVVGAAIAAGALATGAETSSHAMSNAGAELTRLLRAMAAFKALMAAGVAAAVLWRLGAAVKLASFGAYALACGAMAAGPALIWGMAHVGAGALLLHGGLLAAVLLLWRDPVVSRRLAAMVTARRASLNARG